MLLAALPSLAAANDADDRYFGGQRNPVLTQQEKDALRISDEFRGLAPSAVPIKPIPGQYGAVRFVYGVNQPQLVCAVLQVCDIVFQAGEQVIDVHIGDSTRWEIAPSTSGMGAKQRTHIIVKPFDVNLKTNLIVNTDRRSYYIQLRSHRNNYMPVVEFTYPEDAQAKFAAIQRQEIQQREAWTTPKGQYLGNLNFEYTVESSDNVRWTPERIYNDGNKTIIEMPETISQTDIPALVVVYKEGGMFSSDQTRIVNYRFQNNKYIVDSVPEKIILLAGVGSKQERVTIRRKKKG